MKIIKVILLLTLLPAAVFAQKTVADSMYSYQQDRQVINYVQQNGTQLITAGIDKLSIATLNYQTANGHFRTSQTAESSRDVSFGTSGITTQGRFKLFGDFKFTRTWQDSLAWTLKGVPDAINPYYFAAGKAGKYQRINYTMNALGVYRLTGDKLYIASGLNYFYNTAAGSVDPRASVQTFHMLLTPELIYKRGNHALGFNILWGYEHEDNSVGYKNINYSSGQAYPDRILYQVFGYGSFAQAGIKNLRRKGDYLGAGLNYAYADQVKYLRTRLSYQEHNEDELYALNNSPNYGSYGTFYLKRYELSLLAGISSARYRQQLWATVYYSPGKDYNTTLKASSYKYKATSALVGYSIQTKNSSPVNAELGVSALYIEQSQRDLSVSHTFNYTYVQPGIQGSLYKKYANASSLKFTLAPAVRLPVKNYLYIPAAELNQVFNNNITYPDYSYYTSTLGVLNTGAEFITPHLFSGVYSSLAVNCAYYRPFSTGRVYPGSTFTPSGNFINASFSFNIYF